MEGDGLYYKLVSKLDYECLEVSFDLILKNTESGAKYQHYFSPKEILDSVKEMILLLSEYDDAEGNRDSEKDLGGYVVLFTDVVKQDNVCYQKLMERYALKPEYMEYEDIIVTINNDEDSTILEWVRQVFILSCDYALALVFPRGKSLC